MARRNDLAGLAALGALGLLLRKKQDGSSVPVEDRGARAVAASVADSAQGKVDEDLGAIYAEDGTRSKLRRNLETGDLYSPDEAITRPRATAIASKRPASTTRTPAPNAVPQRSQQELDSIYRQQQYEQAQRQAASPEGRAERQRMEQSQALEAVRPEEYLLGGSMMGLKGVASAAQNLARRHAARNVEKIPEYIQPAIGYSDRARLAYSGGDKAAKGATKQLPGPTRQIEYEAADTARDKVFNPLAWMAGPKGMRDDFKKGGKVKKAAPARSSASSRGDGIAKRGKTRGKMF